MRRVFGIVAGIIVAVAIITIVEMFGHRLYPPPTIVSPDQAAAATAYIAQTPSGAKLLIVAGWFLGALGGGYVAGRIARSPAAAWVIGALIAAGGIYNATQITAPLWMQLATVFAPALGALTAHHLTPRSRRPRFG